VASARPPPSARNGITTTSAARPPPRGTHATRAERASPAHRRAAHTSAPPPPCLRPPAAPRPPNPPPPGIPPQSGKFEHGGRGRSWGGCGSRPVAHGLGRGAASPAPQGTGAAPNLKMPSLLCVYTCVCATHPIYGRNVRQTPIYGGEYAIIKPKAHRRRTEGEPKECAPPEANQKPIKRE